MSFLPEDDREYFALKQIEYQELQDSPVNGQANRGVLFPSFPIEGRLLALVDSQLRNQSTCELLVLIPKGYSTTKLDSFYTRPRLRRSDNTDPDRAAGEQVLFGKAWQFWSRHLAEGEWRDGVDGFSTYLELIRVAMRSA